VTYRSFSRFVRWYRWAILGFSVGGTLMWVGGFGAGRVTALSAVGVTLLLGAAFPLSAAICKHDDTVSRARRMSWKRLRSQPLRGWTK
jgi:hypothetical protein